MFETTLRENLLTYLAYCLEGKSFIYAKCQKDFDTVGIKTTVATLRKEFSIAKKEGLITYNTHYRKPYPILSTKGKLEIKANLPFRKFGDFDSVWNMVIFDIPERLRNQRLKFQEELIEVGFGKLSRGVYISPHPILEAVKKIAENLIIEDYVTYIKAKTIEDEKRTVFRAWKLNGLNEKYEKFITKAKFMTFNRRPFWPLYAKSLEKEFAAIYTQDPQLPKEYWPTEWKGLEAYDMFKSISNSY